MTAKEKNKPRKPMFKSCLRFFAHFTCIVGFLAIVIGELEKYFAGQTSLAMSYLPTKTQKLPTLVFCSDDPYLPNSTWSADMSDYAANVPNLTVHSVNDYGPGRKSTAVDANVNIRYMDTMYNGRCQVLESDLAMTGSTFVRLDLQEQDFDGGRTLWMYVFSPGEEILLIYQNWSVEDVNFLQLTKNAFINFYARKFEFLTDYNTYQCEENASRFAYSDCLKRHVWDGIVERGFECIPSHLDIFSPGQEDIKICQRGEDATAKEALVEGGNIWEDVKAAGVCKISCSMTSNLVLVSDINYIKGSPYHVDRKEGQVSFYLYYPSTQDIIHSQHYVSDLLSMLSSIGGGMGLFLGLSCLGGALALLEFIFK